MADEYIRLDTTIMGIDGLINEAPTGSQARALLCAKDMIYDQQRYVSEMEPVKRGRWFIDDDRIYLKCSNCKEVLLFNLINGVAAWKGNAGLPPFCPCCGADMR